MAHSKNKPASLEEILRTCTPYVKGVPVSTQRKEKFIKGPISWQWITTAGQLSGSALKVGLILWFLAGLNRSRTVKLSNRYLDEFGLHRTSKYKAIKDLEKAGLVSVAEGVGKSPTVTIIE